MSFGALKILELASCVNNMEVRECVILDMQQSKHCFKSIYCRSSIFLDPTALI
jgi:hypothetical protein